MNKACIPEIHSVDSGYCLFISRPKEDFPEPLAPMTTMLPEFTIKGLPLSLCCPRGSFISMIRIFYIVISNLGKLCGIYLCFCEFNSFFIIALKKQSDVILKAL
jgi:hypothetical protein